MNLQDLKWAVAELACAASGRSFTRCGCEACDRLPDSARGLDGAVPEGFACTTVGNQAEAPGHSAASANFTGS